MPAVCYDKLEIQINIPNASKPSTEVLLLLFVQRNCLRIRPWDSSPFFLTFLGIYTFVILFIITEQANPRLCSLLHGQDSYVDSYFSTWVVQPPTSKVVQRDFFCGFMSQESI